jgi:hypothetical protein
MAEQFRHFEDENFDLDPERKVRQKLVIDTDGMMHLSTEQKVDHIVDLAHANAMDVAKHERIPDDVRVAIIPDIVQFELRQKGIWQDKNKLRSWLNDGEGKVYKTVPWRI